MASSRRVIPQLLYTTLEAEDGRRAVLPLRAAENSRLLKHLLKALAVLQLEQRMKGSSRSSPTQEEEGPETIRKHPRQSDVGEKEVTPCSQGSGPENGVTTAGPSSFLSPVVERQDAAGLCEGRNVPLSPLERTNHAQEEEEEHQNDVEDEGEDYRCFVLVGNAYKSVQAVRERQSGVQSLPYLDRKVESSERDGAPPTCVVASTSSFSSSFIVSPAGSQIMDELSSVVVRLPMMSFRTLCEVAEYLVSTMSYGNVGVEDPASGFCGNTKNEIFQGRNMILENKKMDSPEHCAEVKQILKAADFLQC